MTGKTKGLVCGGWPLRGVDAGGRELSNIEQAIRMRNGGARTLFIDNCSLLVPYFIFS
jgi:hypothetical protein